MPKQNFSTRKPVEPAPDSQTGSLPGVGEFRERIRSQARQGLRVLLEQVLVEEMDELIGCEWGESSPERKGWRNGYRYRDLLTSQGRLEELKVPRDRAGQFQSELFEQYHRVEPQVEEALLEMWCAGTSQEKVGQIAKTLTGVAISDSAISRLSQSLGEEFESWRKLELPAHYQIVYLDAVYFSVRFEDKSARTVVLAALGVDVDGNKEVLALAACAEESEAGWRELLHDLKKRGLAKVSLIVSDGHAGIIGAVKEVYPSTTRQRCLRHKQEDILSHIPKKVRAEVGGHLSGIFQATNHQSALTQLQAFKVRYGKIYGEAIRSLEDDEGASLSFFELEAKWWKYARTSNAIESLFSGVRNRTNPIKVFTTEHSCLTIVWAAIRGIKLARLMLKN